MSVFQGSTPKFLTRIKDSSGVQLDPSDVDQVIEMFIWIYNAISGAIIAKLYLNTLPEADVGWRALVVKQIVPGDKRLLFYLTKEESEAAHSNNNEIEIKLILPDVDAPDGEYITIGKKRFSEVKPAKS
jgi:hypothetical protein